MLQIAKFKSESDHIQIEVTIERKLSVVSVLKIMPYSEYVILTKSRLYFLQ
jgi:hypothetical protein